MKFYLFIILLIIIIGYRFSKHVKDKSSLSVVNNLLVAYFAHVGPLAHRLDPSMAALYLSAGPNNFFWRMWGHLSPLALTSMWGLLVCGLIWPIVHSNPHPRPLVSCHLSSRSPPNLSLSWLHALGHRSRSHRPALPSASPSFCPLRHPPFSIAPRPESTPPSSPSLLAAATSRSFEATAAPMAAEAKTPSLAEVCSTGTPLAHHLVWCPTPSNPDFATPSGRI